MRVRIGKVGRPHGIDGAFFVEQPSEDGRWWKTGATFLAGGAPVEVVAHRRSSGRPVIKLDRPAERGAALEVEQDGTPGDRATTSTTPSSCSGSRWWRRTGVRSEPSRS